jgi:hypothetical protein
VLKAAGCAESAGEALASGGAGCARKICGIGEPSKVIARIVARKTDFFENGFIVNKMADGSFKFHPSYHFYFPTAKAFNRHLIYSFARLNGAGLLYRGKKC